MKSLNHLFTLTICTCLLVSSSSVYAEPGEKNAPKKTTNYGYDRNKTQFCSEGADGMMDKLQAANADQFKKLEKYKAQISSLTTYDNVLAEMETIKNNYLNSVASAAEASKSNDLPKKLDAAKGIIRNGLVLTTIGTLVDKQSQKGAAPKTYTMNGLCDGLNFDKAICKKSQAPKKGMIPEVADKILALVKTPPADPKNNFKPNSEVHKLDQVVGDFQKVTNTLPAGDQEALRTQVKKIVNDIPKDIAPETLLASLDSDAPVTSKLLYENISREDLLSCLSDKTDKASMDACNKILEKPENRQLLIDTISKETTKVSKNANKYSDVIQVAKANNKDELQKAFESVDLTTKASSENSQKMISEATTKLAQTSEQLTLYNQNEKEEIRKQQTERQAGSITIEESTKEDMRLKETDLNDIENFFYKKPTDDTFRALKIDITTKEGAQAALGKQNDALVDAKADAALFKTKCSGADISSMTSENVNFCKGMVEKIIPQVKALRLAHLEKINDLKLKVQQIAGEDNFAATENLKQYVAEKYLCSCEEDKSKLSTNYEQSLVMSAKSCSTQFMTLTKIEGLSDSSSKIAQALYAHEINMPMDKEGCTFSPEKLKRYSDTCDNNKQIGEDYKSVCESISSEYVVKVKEKNTQEKQDAKWEKYHQDYYVAYDSKSPQGYTVTKKKSNWRVFGEGVLPILPNALPIWLGNYQMKNNIDTLTDQAMMQKQYLHNIDIYNTSPWMYNYNYFSYGNPFATNTSTGLGTSSTGFNFGM